MHVRNVHGVATHDDPESIEAGGVLEGWTTCSTSGSIDGVERERAATWSSSVSR
jgi:hypothetical protein